MPKQTEIEPWYSSLAVAPPLVLMEAFSRLKEFQLGVLKDDKSVLIEAFSEKPQTEVGFCASVLWERVSPKILERSNF